MQNLLQLSSRVHRPNTFLIRLVGVFFLLWVFTFLFTSDRTNWLIENLLVIVLTPMVVLKLSAWGLQRATYYFLFAFATLHVIGSQYAYASVPFGIWLQDTFHLLRNPYDRMVHFSFGFLIAFPLQDIIIQKYKVSGWRQYIMPVEIILSLSAFFELIEWFIGGVLMPDCEKTYVGTQGDIWDAQKDMAMALLGAFLIMGIVSRVHKRKQQPRFPIASL